jgi:hypothetical protein
MNLYNPVARWWQASKDGLKEFDREDEESDGKKVKVGDLRG